MTQEYGEQVVPGRTALMLAAALGHSAIVRRLLQGDAQPGIRNHQGHTAMSIAVQNDNAECARAIKAHLHATLNAQTQYTIAALMELSWYTLTQFPDDGHDFVRAPMVRIHSLQQRPELNGQRGRPRLFDGQGRLMELYEE